MFSCKTVFIRCVYLPQRNITELYFGEQCQCDHLESCGGISEDGELCLGVI